MVDILLFLLGVALYFLPGFLAMGKRNDTAIWLLNLFLGWTVIGWIGALVWAATDEPPQPKIVNQINSTTSRTQELERLKKLLDDGAISQTEYNSEKERILK